MGSLEFGVDQSIDTNVGGWLLPHEPAAISHYGQRRSGIRAFVAHQNRCFATPQNFDQTILANNRFGNLSIATLDKSFPRDIPPMTIGKRSNHPDLLSATNGLHDRVEWLNLYLLHTR